jgi:hydroxypyruvate isomerase
MPRFAANLTMMFNEVPFPQRFGAAARAGFRAVEFLFPYDYPIETIKAELDEHELELVLFNMPAGNWSAGDRGLACDPTAVEQVRQGVATAVEYARALGCSRVHLMAGLKPRGASEGAMYDAYVGNVQYAAAELARYDMTLLLEAINTRDMPGFYLNTSRQAFELIEAIGASNVRFQYDVYHMQIMEGNLIDTIKANVEKIAHIQIADVPGRHEPGTGEINYPNVLKAIDESGYQGYVALEYVPLGDTQAGLDAWLPPEQRAVR